jgi:hypothetical protein
MEEQNIPIERTSKDDEVLGDNDYCLMEDGKVASSDELAMSFPSNNFQLRKLQ